MVTINPETGLGFNNKHGYRHGTPEYNRNNNLLSKHGITLSTFNEMLSRQSGKCVICLSAEPKGRNWHVDHDHRNDRVRGVLCGLCNTAIGKLREDPEIFNRALKYLEKHNGKNT